MNFTTVVNKRKAVRKYLDKKVEEEKINKILEIVNLAPSAGNLQAYKILIIKDKEKINSIAKTTGGIQRNFINLPPLMLIFCANREESAVRYSERGRNLYSIQDATIACTYVQLAAVSLGLASCWVGSFDEEKIKEIIKTDLLPVAILPIGYSDENPPRRPRKSLAEISQEVT